MLFINHKYYANIAMLLLRTKDLLWTNISQEKYWRWKDMLIRKGHTETVVENGSGKWNDSTWLNSISKEEISGIVEV